MTEEKKQTILYVEDNLDLVEVITPWLKEKGFNAVTFDSPHNAQRYLRGLDGHNVDILLTDICFEKESAYDVEHLLEKATKWGVSIIIFSAAIYKKESVAEPTDLPEKPEFLEGLEFIEKPADCSEIMAKIKKVAAERKEKEDALLGRRFTVILVDDVVSIGSQVAKNMRSEMFRVLFSSDPKRARKRMYREKIEFVVLDLECGYGSLKFMDDCLKKGLQVILWTGATWDETPNIDGVRIVRKPSTQREILVVLKDVAYEVVTGKRTAGLSEDIIKKLANPIAHTDTPIEKWVEWAFSNKDAPLNEQKKAAEYVTRTSLEKEIARAAQDGNWPKREMDEMMFEYLRHVKRTATFPVPKKYVRARLTE